jgi:hypothetical protein
MSNADLLIAREPHDAAKPTSFSADDEESKFTGFRGVHKKVGLAKRAHSIGSLLTPEFADLHSEKIHE